jgi:trans-aconitate 2-methyltransferase
VYITKDSFDVKIPSNHQALIDLFVKACRADDRVLAAFLGGSYTRGAADFYSDLDLYLITTDDDFDDFCAYRESFLQLLGEPVFVEDFDNPDIVFFIFADGIEGELGIGRESRFEHIHSGPYKVLMDKKNILEGAVFPDREPGGQQQTEKLRRFIYWFWHDLSHFITAVGRGELWWAQGQLEVLRGVCVNLARLRHNFSDPDAGEETYFKLEQAIPVAGLSPIQSSFRLLDKDGMVDAGLAIVRFYTELAIPLADAHGIIYPERLEQVMVSRLDRLCETKQERETEISGSPWDPSQYQIFAHHRFRPALELLDQVSLANPRVIYDLGCGAGEVTRIIAKRWPSAIVYGVDNSKEMLGQATSELGDVHWLETDIRTWSPDEPPDLIYSNATLHWVEDHRKIFPRLLGFLKAGGCLAVQMPLSWETPSHRLMRETLADGGPNGEALGTEQLRHELARNWVEDAEVYFDLLVSCTQSLDIWETEYFQILEGDDPVLEWVRGTGLRPVLQGLSDEEREIFLPEYARRLRAAYPSRPDGRTLYPFRRLFMVAMV